MIVKIHLKSPLWQEKYDGVVKQRGTYWPEDKRLLDTQDIVTLGKQLEQKNGFYALVWKVEGMYFAAVDHIRSIPLFYALKNNKFYLSDDAEWIRREVENTELDATAKEEFQLAGYVTGSETLLPDVKQLQAGELLSISQNYDGTLLINKERYYRFIHAEPDQYSESALYKKLDDAALTSIDNLIHYANGRQIVVPLSGGYDSRLIATLLKRRGYQNILTFTYGLKKNRESAYSKEVADALGLRWLFVEYNDQLWRGAWQTEERWHYQKWASAWNSIAHVQDWLAVKLMKQRGSIDEDAIFAPGHSGDFVAGSHIPSIAFEENYLSLGDACRATLNRHYSLAPRKLFKTKETVWLNRIRELKESEKFSTPTSFASCFEKWDWQERQAKFICNSVRVYEFFNYDWWMPLWDRQFIRFWQGAPLELRKRREWYVNYVKIVYSENSKSNEKPLNNASDKSSFVTKLRGLPIFRAGLIKTLVKIILRQKNHLSHEAWFERSYYIGLANKGYNINGMVAKKLIDDLSATIDDNES